MSRIDLARDVPHPQSLVYGVVADIARYPEFLPGFQDVRLEGWDGDALRVLQTVGVKGLTVSFRSRAAFDSPHAIDIRATDTPFRFLDQHWRFDTRPNGVTHVELHATYELKDRLVGRIFDRAFPTILRRGLEAFEKRAAIMQGRPQAGAAPMMGDQDV